MRSAALVLLAAAVLAVALVRVATRRFGHDGAGRAWIERPGWPVELSGDGVYFVPPASTVRDVLGAAEHPCRSHAPREPVAPGDLVTVGRDCRVQRDRMPAAARLTLGLGIDLDREDARGIAALPAIGPRLAARIVADREARGPFGGLEGLLRVRGVGPRTIERVRPFVQSASVSESFRPAVR